jgi:hypothetical protein
MPADPAGEAALRALSERFAQAEARIRALLARAPAGDRRALLTEALSILPALRREGARGPIAIAYLAAFAGVVGGPARRQSPKRLKDAFQLRNALRAFDRRIVPSQTRSCRKRSSLSFTRAPHLPAYFSGQRFLGERGEPPTARRIRWSSS